MMLLCNHCPNVFVPPSIYRSLSLSLSRVKPEIQGQIFQLKQLLQALRVIADLEEGIWKREEIRQGASMV